MIWLMRLLLWLSTFNTVLHFPLVAFVSRKEADEAHHSRRALSSDGPESDTNGMPFLALSGRHLVWIAPGTRRRDSGEWYGKLAVGGSTTSASCTVPYVTCTARRAMPFSPAPAGSTREVQWPVLRGRWLSTFPHGCRIGRALATFMNDAVATATDGDAPKRPLLRAL
jgi:hypothetical protein